MPYLTYTAENLIMPPAHHGYVRRMAVADMPDTRCKRSLLLRIENPETAVVTIVARWNYDGSWEAYIGWPRDAHFNQGVIEGYGETYIRAVVTHTLTARGTASHGTVIQGDDALALFPALADAPYGMS